MGRSYPHFKQQSRIFTGSAKDSFATYVDRHNRAVTTGQPEKGGQPPTSLGFAIGRRAVFEDSAALGDIELFYALPEPSVIYTHTATKVSRRARDIFNQWPEASVAARVIKVVEGVLPQTDRPKSHIMDYAVGAFTVDNLVFREHPDSRPDNLAARVAMVLRGANSSTVATERTLVKTAFTTGRYEDEIVSIAPKPEILCNVGTLAGTSSVDALHQSTEAMREQLLGINVTLGSVGAIHRED